MTCQRCRNPYCKCTCDTHTIDAFPVVPESAQAHPVRYVKVQKKSHQVWRLRPLENGVKGDKADKIS